MRHVDIRNRYFAMVAPVRMIKAVATDAVQRLGYADMKPEQLQVVSDIISGRDVVAILLTGFRKSLCFA